MSQLTGIWNKYITQQQHSSKSLFFETSPFTVDYLGSINFPVKYYKNNLPAGITPKDARSSAVHVPGGPYSVILVAIFANLCRQWVGQSFILPSTGDASRNTDSSNRSCNFCEEIVKISQSILPSATVVSIIKFFMSGLLFRKWLPTSCSYTEQYYMFH